jgi:predicted kinase
MSPHLEILSTIRSLAMIDLLVDKITQQDGPLVVILIGPSGSGKSTLGEHLVTELRGRTEERTWEMIASDECRRLLSGDTSNMEVSYDAFKMLNHVLTNRCKYGQNTVVDATSVKRSDRQDLMKTARHYRHDFKVIGVLVQTPLETCKSRQRLRGRQVPEPVLDRQYQNFERTLQEVSAEAFTAVFHYDTETNTTTEVALCPIMT